MVLNISLDASFSIMQDCEGIWEKSGEVNSMKGYVTNNESAL
jgi:hypothetical protein